MPTFTGKRGEISRSRKQVEDAGGLVPKLGHQSNRVTVHICVLSCLS
ncbi:MAG: hypothetical protein HRT38_07825 [Alteromonadaceae bacterium]|nr:hypothetical protein [Alteromonadaceae bacterium]